MNARLWWRVPARSNDSKNYLALPSRNSGSPVRVLISAYVCDPFGGSEGANAWFTAEGLAHAGAEVHILTRESDAEKTDAGITEYSKGPGLGRLTATYLPDSVPLGLSSGQLGVYARYAAWQMRCHAWARDASNGPWDVGHHVSWGSLSHPVGLAGCGFPLVIGPVGGGQSLHPDHECWLDGDPQHDRRRAAALRRIIPLSPVSRYAAKRAALVLATNDETVSLARDLGAKRVELGLPEGLRPGQLRAIAPAFPEVPEIVWIGRFLPLKAAGLAIAAFRRVAAEEPRARLTMVGDGPTRGLIETSAADLVASGAVRFAGRVPWDEAQAVLASARVHLFTSVRDSSSAQTLEAAALGVPTVALDAYGSSSFLHRTGFALVEPLPGNGLDTRFAAAALDTLRLSPDRWLDESNAVRDFAAEHQYRGRAQTLLGTYRGLPSSPGMPIR